MRYAVCRNDECREQNTYIPIKHGNKAMCYACNEYSEILSLEEVHRRIEDRDVPVFEIDGVVFEKSVSVLEQARSELRSMRSFGAHVSMSRGSIDCLLDLVSKELGK